MTCTQYDIFLVNLDPTVGSEIRKTRPCVLLSPNELNGNLNTVIIAPITSNSKPYPTLLKTKSVKPYGWIVLHQIRTIDKSRIIKKIGQLTSDEISACKCILEELLVW
jgi:mRNA interferase MazF